MTTCSFCGKPRRCYSKQQTDICDECVGLCCAILAEKVGVGVEADVPASQLSVEWIERVVNKLERRAIITDWTCSFCGADADQCTALIAGPRVYICDGCVVSAVSAFVSAT